MLLVLEAPGPISNVSTRGQLSRLHWEVERGRVRKEVHRDKEEHILVLAITNITLDFNILDYTMCNMQGGIENLESSNSGSDHV